MAEVRAVKEAVVAGYNSRKQMEQRLRSAHKDSRPFDTAMEKLEERQIEGLPVSSCVIVS